MAFDRLPDNMVGKLALAFLLVALLAGGTLPASAATLYAATYTVPNFPPSLGAGAQATVAVTVLNTGTASWNATAANPVNLSYHWYDPSGVAVVWDGARTSLVADMAPGVSRTLNAVILGPPSGGIYQLRFALVKEGVAWFDPEPSGHPITIIGPFAATFGAITAPAMIADGTYQVNVSVTNAGSSLWVTSGANLIDLAYHWLDSTGKTVVWDGVRTALGGDVPVGGQRTVSATVVAPPIAGQYLLAFDLVREGVAWFNQPMNVPTAVQPATYRATYTVGAMSTAFIGESKTIPVTVTNTGNVPWRSTWPSLVDASYHWVDSSGRIAVWDGARTALPADVVPGQAASLQLAVIMPAQAGTYTLQIDLVREGVAWFSSLGSSPATLGFQVTSGFAAGYGADTTPSSITPGAGIPISIDIANYGQRAWSAGGPNPVRLSYHIYNSSGGLVVWDGARGALPGDIAPGGGANVSLVATAPDRVGSYTLVLDLVQEGVGWFSGYGIAGKEKPLSVFPGVTFYGKGWGHGVGLSQWGAQGWATGAAGTPLTGEQIALKYYPGAAISPFTSSQNFRVLLSQPSTGCVGRTVYDLAQMRSDGGVYVLNEAANRAQLLRAAPQQTVRVWVEGSLLKVMDEWSGNVIYTGTTPIVLTPVDGTKPTTVVQKLRWYRGDLRFEIAGVGMLRVVNWVNPDDYARGSVPAEMLSGWHVEAYKAQSYAAKSYAAWKQATMQAVAYDLRDDTSDQCYGGASVETTAVNQAVAATAGTLLTYNGQPIRAYYASSSGGSTDGNGCVWKIIGSPSTRYSCGPNEPYLGAVPDPADLVAVGPSGLNPHRSWTRTFTAGDIENAVLRSGYDIGAFVSIDLSDLAPGGHVIAVRVNGTAGSVWLPADTFFRTKLGMKSTMVRTFPF